RKSALTNSSRAMAQPGPSAHLGHLSPAPRSPSAGAAQTTQDRPPSCPARSEGPLRRPRRRGSPQSTTRRNRPPRRHPPLAYSSNRLCSRTPPLTGPAPPLVMVGEVPVDAPPKLLYLHR